MVTLDQLCRICSDDIKDNGVGIFSSECMEQLVGEKIKRYLYFSVSMKDELPKKVCPVCLKKLDNIHRFAKMAGEMQEKFRMLLSIEEANQSKPKIKIRSLEELNSNVKPIGKEPKMEIDDDNAVNGEQDSGIEGSEGVEMAFDVVVEEVGGESLEEAFSQDEDQGLVNGQKENQIQIKKEPMTDETSADEESSSKDEKPSASLLHSLLIKGKNDSKTSLDIDHDYLPTFKEELLIKDEPEDPEDEDIAEEIEEDRLNQIIKEEMEETDSEYEGGSNGSDVEVTEMEVKVDPMLYFSNTSQSAIELDQDSEDNSQPPPTPKTTPSKTKSTPPVATTSQAAGNTATPLQMTRSQQRVNPVIASLKLGKPYKCTVCPRSFITDIGLQNHLWSHLPKSRKTGASNVMIHKNVDLEDSQVYSSNGVLHTALPSENIHLLKYVCPICGKKISTKGNLKVHLETHRPKGKYGCDICGRVFKTAANLYRHKDYHGGVQFPCNVCGRVYPTNSTLRAHSITHSNQRPHKCPLCSKTFKRNQDLKFHINQHTGARPYQCPYCPKAFASSGNCFSHRKRMHPMEVERDKERAAEIMG